MTTTVWDARDDRRWPLRLAVGAVLAVGLHLLLVFFAGGNVLSGLGVVLLAVAVGWRDARLRVRLTPDGVEVRRLRTTLYRYAEIDSVRVAPDWAETCGTVWIRLRGAVPQSEPEVLRPPPGWGRSDPEQALAEVVAEVQGHVDEARTVGRSSVREQLEEPPPG
ncbi:hypothetical protein GCM10022197_02850 [Microlunatus spumicola]|uniref:PH domain-containing protein n=1 Tax=Microlunatus spumicola TaxID=81499 RepID=A0ABP6WJI6_9ACTN